MADATTPPMVKLLLLRARLTGGSETGAEIALDTPYDDSPAAAAQALQAMLAAMLPAIDQELRHADRP